MNYILKYIKIEKLFYIILVFPSIDAFYSIYDQINTALVNIRDFFQKYKKNTARGWTFLLLSPFPYIFLVRH